MHVIRNIAWYAPGSRRAAGERVLSHGEIEEVLPLFIPRDGDPYLQEVYMLTGHHAELIAERIGMRFDLNAYEYRLECFYAGKSQG